MSIIHTYNFIEIDKKIEYVLKETIAYFRRQVRMADEILQIKTNLQRVILT
jgi:hypothetical protein